MDRIRQAAAAGRASFGSWVTLCDTVAAELMGRAGFDWVIVDTQHGAIDWHGLLPVLQALELGGTRALVRVGWNEPGQIMRALDLGAIGVVVPMVSTPGDARRAVEAASYPPHGNRSFGRVRSPYAAADGPEPDRLCLPMIETAEGLRNVDAIAATPGVDGLFVGPVDLALALGLGPALVMPDPVLEAIDRVVEACRRHGKIAGCASLGAPNARLLMGRGVGFVTLGSDAGMIRRAAAADVAQVRDWLAAAQGD